MNHKQKLGYMALGAGILALGIIIGQIITPDIKAQNNGVFDKITCRELEVVDEKGETGIGLVSDRRGNRVSVYDKQEKVAIDLSHFGSIECQSLYIANEEGKRLVNLGSSIMKKGGYVGVFDENGTLVGQIIGEGGNSFGSFDNIESREIEVGDMIESLNLEVIGEIQCGGLEVLGSSGETAIELSGRSNSVNVYGEHGKEAVSLTSFGHGAINRVTVYDEHGDTGVNLSSSGFGNRVVVSSDDYGYDRVHLGSGFTFGGIDVDGVTVLDHEGNVEWKAP